MNPEHEKILRQGVEVWNKWREDNPDDKPNFHQADLRDSDLSQINARFADFSGADLSGAKLRSVDLTATDLSGANLSRAKLIDANFNRAILHNTDLSSAILSSANFSSTDLSDAKLIDADLSRAIFHNANLSGTNLEGIKCGFTIFANLDLSTTKGLDTVIHTFPSTIDIDTLFRSKGKIPEIFLRGCGVSETLITFLPSMLEEAIQFYSCFISYSHADKEFAKRLHDRLQGVGIRCWLDEYQLNPGDKLHSTIYEAIRRYDKVILCCSETALKSWWVEKEFENATTKEEDYAEAVLIPITLDNYLFEQSIDHPIIGEIREKRVVQDFSGWKEHDAFEQAFEKVVKALRTDGGKPPPPTSKLTRRK